MASASSTSSILSVRVTSAGRAILEAAAEQSPSSLSEFVRRKALESAETEVLSRAVITISPHDGDAFEAWIGRKATAIPALVDLARRTPSWEA